MASISPRFMQESGRKKAGVLLSNFRMRTDRPLGEIEKGKLLRGQLEPDLQQDRQRAITALEFRRADEQTRQFERVQGLRESQFAEEKKVQGLREAEFRRNADEQTRQFERAQGLRESEFAEERKLIKEKEGRQKLKGTVSGTGTGAFAGFQAGAKLGGVGGPIGAIVGGIIGAVIGRRK